MATSRIKAEYNIRLRLLFEVRGALYFLSQKVADWIIMTFETEKFGANGVPGRVI